MKLTKDIGSTVLKKTLQNVCFPSGTDTSFTGNVPRMGIRLGKHGVH
ncbi:hypothetical protein Celaphus_00004670 [Cervus elaphus hippelaphus]|uniref:Uncharacterized protein n=1 Tax=Cervus elaphus hippelaphus TaxID=46360 RepID=A0A212DE61_CEREH|nr:hypothetical protein Celaphus_00004670 [Cervus elaphus hippelaphus]